MGQIVNMDVAESKNGNRSSAHAKTMTGGIVISGVGTPATRGAVRWHNGTTGH